MSAPTLTPEPVTIPNGAAALVELAELERLERRAWGRWIVAAGTLREMDKDHPDYAEEAWCVRACYLLWAAAWEQQSKARRQITKGEVT